MPSATIDDKSDLIQRRTSPCVRTLHIEWAADGTVGGSHQALFDLVAGLDKNRFEPVVLFNQMNRFASSLMDLGIEVHDYGPVFEQEATLRRSAGRIAKGGAMAAAIRRRMRFLREHNIGLLHLNNSPSYGGMDWMPAAKLIGIPALSSIMEYQPYSASLPWRAIFRRFDRVLPVSRIVADSWIAAGIPPERVRVVHHGVDAQRVRARCTREPGEVRVELGVPDGRLLVVMGGNVRHWKGQHVVLEGLTRLSAEDQARLYIVFAGATSAEDRDYYAGLQDYVEQNRLGAWVRFLGFRSDLPNLLRAADIVIHASIQVEPSGIVVLEAMTLGSAVVAADMGGHTEVMVEGTGLTFNTKDPQTLAQQVSALTASAELRAQLGHAAVERVAEFSVERNVRRTESVYAELLRGR